MQGKIRYFIQIAIGTVGCYAMLFTRIITKTCPCNIQIFLALKIEHIQLKMFDIFLIFAQNIDCGYTLEPPR